MESGWSERMGMRERRSGSEDVDWKKDGMRKSVDLRKKEEGGR